MIVVFFWISILFHSAVECSYLCKASGKFEQDAYIEHLLSDHGGELYHATLDQGVEITIGENLDSLLGFSTFWIVKKNNSKWLWLGGETPEQRFKIIRVAGSNFLLNWRVDEFGNHTYFWISLIGNEQEADKFMFQVGTSPVSDLCIFNSTLSFKLIQLQFIVKLLSNDFLPKVIYNRIFACFHLTGFHILNLGSSGHIRLLPSNPRIDYAWCPKWWDHEAEIGNKWASVCGIPSRSYQTSLKMSRFGINSNRLP